MRRSLRLVALLGAAACLTGGMIELGQRRRAPQSGQRLDHSLTAAAPVADAPVLVPDQSVWGFDDIGLYQVGYAYRGQPENYFPLGAVLDFEQGTGVACRPDQPQNEKRTFLLHCPWRDGTGVAFQQFRVELPLVKAIALRGATALRTDALGKSDGATFRVYVDQVKLLDVNRRDDVWQPFSFDLTASAGKVVLIRFETGPGPADNPAFDFSLWGDRQLALEGYQPPVQAHPAVPPLELKKVLNGGGSVVPFTGFASSRWATVENDTATLRYSGEDGDLTFRWVRPTSAGDPPLGNVTLQAQLRGDQSYNVPLAGDARIEWTGSMAWQESHWESGADGFALVTSYRGGSGTATVRARASLAEKSLLMDVSCDRSVVGSFTAGSWGPAYRRRPVPVPCYSGDVFFLTGENLFVHTFLDWTASAASYFQGTVAGYDARTDGSRVPLQERVVFSAAWHLAETLPNIPNPPSGYKSALGGRAVLDIWSGSFAEIAQRIRDLASYGLDRCAAIVHNWQRSGYDNALPTHIPAQAALGGEEGMRELTASAAQAGYLAALHENYADYYPNYDHFSENDIALDSSGQRVLAWRSPLTGIQSFGERPDAMVRLASTQSPEMHRRYGTTASYLDVNSAVSPWKNVDHRAGTARAAQFRQYSDNAPSLWQYLGATHGGPVFGEGGSHWYWSGLLDGVEGQFGAGWPAGRGREAPLLVDFDLLKIHPLQVNHGMGYYERWWDSAAAAFPPPMVVMDQYRVQEIAYGRAPFVGDSVFWSSLPLAWLEHHLMTRVASLYGDASPARISYQIDGSWKDSAEAARQQNWSRVKVEYENGLTITANGTDSPMTEGPVQLPAFGWLAQSDSLVAGTTLRSGAVTDFADSGDSVFANARSAVDWDFRPRTALPAVAGFAQTGSRALAVTYSWQVFGNIPGDYSCFVHFVTRAADGSEQIVFQQDHSPDPPTSAWSPGTNVQDGPYAITVPAAAPDGDYQWMIGLFLSTGPRLPLVGGDGESRAHLGVLHVRNGGATITFDPDTSRQSAAAIYGRNVNNPAAVIDFGPVRTDGSVLIRRTESGWVLQTLPRERAFTLLLDGARFGVPESIACTGGSQASVTPEPAGAGWWRLPMTGAGECRWRSFPARDHGSDPRPRPPVYRK